jgi:hypothetical protein
MIDFSKAGRRPLNWNVLTIDSHEPERYQQPARRRWTAAPRKGARSSRSPCR